MQIVKDYRDNKVLRDSFNELAKKAFYLSQFMRDCVYYIEPSDTYVIAKIGDDKFMFQAIAHA